MFHPNAHHTGAPERVRGAEANTIIPHKTTVRHRHPQVKNQKIEASTSASVEHIRAQGSRSSKGRIAPLLITARSRVRVSDKAATNPPRRRPDLADLQGGGGGGRAGSRDRRRWSADGGRQRADSGLHRHPAPPTCWFRTRMQQPPAQPNEHLRLDHLSRAIRTTAGLLCDSGRPSRRSDCEARQRTQARRTPVR